MDRIVEMQMYIKRVLILSVILVNNIYATTLERLPFEALVEKSSLIIEAVVVGKNIIETDTTISTRVKFSIEAILKGEYSQETISLDYLGGKSSSNSLSISGQNIPEIGDRGFYFIKDPDKQFVNPLTGWSQGEYRIIRDAKGHEIIGEAVTVKTVELTKNKDEILSNKLKQMRFNHKLLNQSINNPQTPDALRDAVYTILENAN